MINLTDILQASILIVDDQDADVFSFLFDQLGMK